MTDPASLDTNVLSEELKAAAKASSDAALAAAIDGAVAHLQKRIGLGDSFFNELSEQDDDWEFFVKGHALLEAVLNEAIVHSLGRRSIEKKIEKMQISAKLEWALDLDLLHAESRNFIKNFSDIRNTCVHKIANVSFSLKSYLKEQKPENVRAFMQAASMGGFVVFEKTSFEENPRAIIAAALKAVLGTLNVQSQLHWMRQSVLKLYLMCKPASEVQQHLWDIAKGASPDI